MRCDYVFVSANVCKVPHLMFTVHTHMYYVYKVIATDVAVSRKVLQNDME